LSISDEHLLLTSRITERQRNNKNRKKLNTRTKTDFQPEKTLNLSRSQQRRIKQLQKIALPATLLTNQIDLFFWADTKPTKMRSGVGYYYYIMFASHVSLKLCLIPYQK